MNKVYPSADAAVADVAPGATVMVGGLGLCGIPGTLIAALHRKGVRDLVVISSDCGMVERGVGLLLHARQIRKVIASSVGENREVEQRVRAGELEVELVPQGTLAERIRAGGAGVGGFYTRTGVGTLMAEGKETRVIGGREYLLEMPLRADFALVRAFRADPRGNLIFRKTARNFNPAMAAAAEVSVAEVEQLVNTGEIDGDAVHLPGAYVKRLVVGGVGGHEWMERQTTPPRA